MSHRLIKLTVLAAQLGISKRTLSDWVRRDPSIAVRKGGQGFWIKLDELAGKKGIGLVDAQILGTARWIKATIVADVAGVPRRKVTDLCRNNARFAIRIGRIWYIDISKWEIPLEEIEAKFSLPKYPKPRGKPPKPLELPTSVRSSLLYEGGRYNRAILMLADGASAKYVAHRLKVTEMTIYRWRKKFLSDVGKSSDSGGAGA